MSDERIDHVAKARELLDHSVESSDKDAAIAMLHTKAAAAQVHATLALAEQQRIANLIALFHHDPELKTGGAASEFAGESWDLLAGQHIREALGLRE